MKDILSFTPDELREEMKAHSEPAFRGKQIFSWLHEKRVRTFDEMTNLPKTLRETLSSTYEIMTLSVLECLSSSDGTRKYLLRLPDGHVIESVFMRYSYGNSVCVSTQVGCRMGCRFCASTLNGLVRNLRASEILSEIYTIEKDTGLPVNHIVLMGSGEPLDNYEEVVRFLRLVTDENGKNLSARNITLSTCGIPDKILSLAGEGLPVTLALSLHAPDDETRRGLMPIAKRYPLSEVLAACDAYFEKTGRRVSYEYSVVKGVNDTEEEAEKLSELLHGKNAHVNLIPVNPIEERNFESPGERGIRAFYKVLEKMGINATIRKSMGADIDGACGQLRRHYLDAADKESD